MHHPYAVVLCVIVYKREAPRSKGDTSGVSAKGTPILKRFLGIRVLGLMGRILNGPGE
ncbi:hypothetical protein TIFTF001_004694 [Ficus carica]|uniref:Uncharacterized protein n=1 Tax=Ficus carica TaxID=3494 RepID=A0AA87ZIF4_FICCA|nr:hypothetical protein TIFTF001_004694 [Ficus carica]